MGEIALRMLLGDRAKYLGLVFGITFATLLMSQQVSIFIGLMARTASQILDVREADIWVMDPRVQYIDEIKALPDKQLARVRGVPGVEWAVPFFKGLGVVRAPGGIMQQVILLGVDDATLTGRPPQMIHGRWEDLKQPDAMIMDRAGWEFTWPGEPFQPGRVIEINDRRVVVVGLAEASPPFVTFPVVFTRYTEALRLAPGERNRMSFVLARAAGGEDPKAVAQRITAQTGLQALTSQEFQWRSINHYLKRTGIPINFGITVVLGFIVGAAVAGQTFYLFVLENLRQFGALKAIGVGNRQILGMVLLQALLVAFVGFSLGIGLSAAFFEATSGVTALRGFILRTEVIAATGGAVALILAIASFASLRKVLVLDPAIVFRG
ncbi:MAG: ABC transporter permease [Betaproteobacteria bacterium]|nr:ABC transporter permease [Betaproteobacteria bacterium]